jgi:hypothetical protein
MKTTKYLKLPYWEPGDPPDGAAQSLAAGTRLDLIGQELGMWVQPQPNQTIQPNGFRKTNMAGATEAAGNARVAYDSASGKFTLAEDGMYGFRHYIIGGSSATTSWEFIVLRNGGEQINTGQMGNVWVLNHSLVTACSKGDVIEFGSFVLDNAMELRYAQAMIEYMGPLTPPADVAKTQIPTYSAPAA